jgi:hypothetical protein
MQAQISDNAITLHDDMMPVSGAAAESGAAAVSEGGVASLGGPAVAETLGVRRGMNPQCSMQAQISDNAITLHDDMYSAGKVAAASVVTAHNISNMTSPDQATSSQAPDASGSSKSTADQVPGQEARDVNAADVGTQDNPTCTDSDEEVAAQARAKLEACMDQLR